MGDGEDADPTVVIAGLDPAIHHLQEIFAKEMDPRVKPGGDQCRFGCARFRRFAT
jgi:hypothetical protein